MKKKKEYTEELYKKGLNDPDNHKDVVTHLESDILEREVKWVLGSITMNKDDEGDGIPAELFKILEDDTVKVLYSKCQLIWETQQWPQNWKMSVFIPIPKKGSAKECSNYCTITLISHASKILLKILQAMLQRIAMSNLDSALKSKHHFADKGLCSHPYMTHPVIMYECELDHQER